ncbi:MAG TPA: tetratricopeptide repeat protein [Bacteroidia bacterium]|nr:tetratricopeptide repeat protein [Bacteroidia bacterium]
MKILKSVTVILAAFLMFSCKSGENKEVVKQEIKDSLIEKLNSPELKAVNEKLKNDPNNAELYNERAKIYIRLKQFDAAIGDAQRSLKIDSTNANYHLTLVDAYFADNKTRQAKETLELVAKKFPDNIEGLLKLGELFFLVRQYESALTQINKALKIDENMARAYYLKGSVFKEMGDTTKAISSMQTLNRITNILTLLWM